MSVAYAIVQAGVSRSFPEGDAFFRLAVAPEQAEVIVYLAGAKFEPDGGKRVVLIELGNESLGYHTGEQQGEEGSNAVGFARYRNGDAAPSALVELVRQKNTSSVALDAARALFESAGLSVVVCGDQAGRIVDRLVRPKYNAALRLLDEGLATQSDIDLTCRLGLGYPKGPIEHTIAGGLAHHCEVTRALFEVYGTPGYAPARRAVVAMQRSENKDGQGRS